ncbi:MAG: response regulator [Deltaproteobacteria bacterium]|nr:response regulator [Deltaproteobacteria bacterium]
MEKTSLHESPDASRHALKFQHRRSPTILIADRNPHVREFLGRELRAEGYEVRLAKNGREVLRWIYHYEPLDLVILDPDLPDASDGPLLEKLNDRIPALPVVVHAFGIDDAASYAGSLPVVFVEKAGNSIENLKKVVAEMLLKRRARQSQGEGEEKSPMHP